MNHRVRLIASAFCITLGLVSLGCRTTHIDFPPPEPGVERTGFSERPFDAAPLLDRIPEGTMYLYQHKQLGGDSQVVEVLSVPAAVPQNDLGKVKGKLSSLQWNLPPGVVVVFHQRDNAKGRQVAVWGNGRYERLSRFNMDNLATAWVWYGVGGLQEPKAEIPGPPLNSDPLSEPLPAFTVTLFADGDYEGDREILGPVSGYLPNRLHRLEVTDDRASSVRWDLPPGVVVLLHQHRKGDGGQVALWGSGQLNSLKAHGFQDMLSRWSWTFVGEK